MDGAAGTEVSTTKVSLLEFADALPSPSTALAGAVCVPSHHVAVRQEVWGAGHWEAAQVQVPDRQLEGSVTVHSGAVTPFCLTVTTVPAGPEPEMPTCESLVGLRVWSSTGAGTLPVAPSVTVPVA